MKHFFNSPEVEGAIREQSSPFDMAIAALKRALFAAGGFSLILNLLQLTIPLYMMQVLDRIMSSGNANSLYLLTFIAVVALVVAALLDIVRSHILNRSASWLETRLSLDLFPKAALAFHRGRLEEASALEDLWRLRSFMSSPALLSLFDVPWMVFYLLVLYMLSVPIGVIATIGGGVLVLIAILGERAVRRQLEPSQSNTKRTRNYLRAIQVSSDELLAMGMMQPVQNRWLRFNMKALKGQYLSAGQAATNLSLFKLSRLLLQLLVLFTGAVLVLKGSASVGIVIGSSIIMSRALAPVEQAISSWKQALSSFGAYRRLKILLSETPQKKRSVKRPDQASSLSLIDVSLAFKGQKQPFIKKINLTAHLGKLTVLIGPSGSGKSVLSQLMVGAVEPSEGFIHLGNYELSHYSKEDLGSYIGYVSQHSGFVPGTIAENLARFRDLPMEDIIEAAQRVGAHDFIIDLPDSYDTDIGCVEGAHLSGGQLQRLALARALCGAPKLLVFDEPNLNLDVESEALLYQLLSEEKDKGTAIIVVSHQREMIQAADQVVYIEKGEIIQSGPPQLILQKLIASNQEHDRRKVSGVPRLHLKHADHQSKTKPEPEAEPEVKDTRFKILKREKIGT